MDLRKHLKNGVFGRMDNGMLFVIVNDKFIYKNGEYDLVSDVNENLELHFKKVEVLMNACSFNNFERQLSENRSKAIYDRRLPKFKVGDVIELTRDYYGIPKGARGEVISNLTEDAPNNYGIDFKMRYPQTHYCAGRLPRATGVFAPEEVLRKIY